MNQAYTLADGVDEFLAMRQISKKKYYASFLIIAKNVWQTLFQTTIYAVQSEWRTLKEGTPYDYIDMPDCVRLFSVATTNHCGEIIPLFYNNLLNVIPHPTTKKCGCACGSCNSEVCEDVNSTVFTTKLLFTDNGTEYFEKKWVKSCPNGDMIEYKEVPTKKYNTFEGDSSPSDYTIVTETFQKTLCRLEVKECGCPTNTSGNIKLLNDCCGDFLPFNSCCKRKHCNNFLGAINSNDMGEVKVSECGTKIYYKPSRRQKTLPEFLLVNFQTSGESCDSAVQVPEYAKEALWAGIQYYSMRFNNSYSINEKADAKYAWNGAQTDLISFLNPLSLEWLSTVQDSKILF